YPCTNAGSDANPNVRTVTNSDRHPPADAHTTDVDANRDKYANADEYANADQYPLADDSPL
ncbi:MAG: hypothetical protein KAX24_15025, partial [Anaerolineae bacterium]|nr:hypothetical protein [Anaerolineae bacterium]